MGHLLKTMNPEAAALLQRANEPMPTMGMAVVLHGQPKHRKRGRTTLTGLVTSFDPTKRTLDLVVVYEAGDMIDVQRVPEYDPDGAGWGWAFAEGSLADLQAQINQLKALLNVEAGNEPALPKRAIRKRVAAI